MYLDARETFSLVSVLRHVDGRVFDFDVEDRFGISVVFRDIVHFLF